MKGYDHASNLIFLIAGVLRQACATVDWVSRLRFLHRQESMPSRDNAQDRRLARAHVACGMQGKKKALDYFALNLFAVW
jgi:hypothetical protein